MDNDDRSRWWILGLVHFSVFSFAVTLQMIPPILGFLVRDLGLSHAQAGTLMGLFTLPGIFLALPGGYLTDRFGPGIIGIGSLALMCAGTFVMLPLNPILLYSGRLLAGVGGSVLIVVAPQIISKRFLGRELGLAMGIFSTAVPLGTIISFNFLGRAAENRGIPSVIVIAGTLSLAALSVYAFACSQLQKDHRTSKSSRSGPGLRSLGRDIWFVALVWTLFNMGIMSFFTFGINYFAISGFGPEMANLMGSLPMVLSIPLVPVFGYIIDRRKWRAGPLAAGSIICSAAFFLLVVDPARAVLWTVLLGLGVSIVPPVIFTLAGEVVPPERAGMSFGLLTAMFNAGILVGIPLVGFIKDLTGTYTASFSLMSLFSLAGAATAAGLIRVKTGEKIL